MKLSEIKGEKALEVLADVLEPLMRIMADKDIKKAYQGENTNKIKFIQTLLKTHSKDVIEIMAILDGADPKTYEINLLSLPAKLLEIINDPIMQDLFSSQAQNDTGTSFGLAMEDTKA